MLVFVSPSSYKKSIDEIKSHYSYNIEIWARPGETEWSQLRQNAIQAILKESNGKLIKTHQESVEEYETKQVINTEIIIEQEVDPTQMIKDRVREQVLQGESQLQAAMASGLSIEHVIWAIMNRKCVFDLGSTYLETIVGNAIRKTFSGPVINQAREIFGMGPVELITPAQMQTYRAAQLAASRQ